MSKKQRSGAFVIRKTDRSRFKLGRSRGGQVLDQLLSIDSAVAPPGVLLVVAHPDDEAIGAGVLLGGLPHAVIVHVTDGAPRDDAPARRRGFANRDAYAQARRAEAVAALRLAGIDEAHIRCLGLVDGEASFRLVELCHHVIDLMLEHVPDVVITHPYEGGHTDHDATAFAVHLACGILRREGVTAPVVLELASYHNRNGKRVRSRFIEKANVPERALDLTPDEQLRKVRMFEQFVSQRACLSAFPIGVERFRVAPRYNFTAPPHEGILGYEQYCDVICGEEWRARAGQALEALRSRRAAPSG
ncbi:MAG: PIG-L family deacetylase [Gemmatimonadaceae bacterium]